MNVDQILNPHPYTTRSGSDLLEVVHITLKHRVQSLPVLDAEDRYVGTVSLTGILHLLLPMAATTEHGLTNLSFVSDSVEVLRQRMNTWKKHRVDDHLDTDAEPIHPDTSIAEALLLIYRTGRNLPVVERDTRRLVGLVSAWEVLNKLF